MEQVKTKELIAQVFIRDDGKPEISSHLLKDNPVELAFRLSQVLAALINLMPRKQSNIVKPDITMSFPNGREN